MAMYLVKTPWLLTQLYSSYIWRMASADKILYLTFDDGPHETATPFVLDELKKYNAKATFFCIGKNVASHPLLYKRIAEEGHAVGNHTQYHLNGWKVKDDIYINDIGEASKHISSRLFRPPYGRIKRSQAKILQSGNAAILRQPFSVIMWDILSGDFDVNLSPQQCLQNVTKHARNGSVIVFHDSTKAWSRMSYALPKVLDHFARQGFLFKTLPT